MCPEELVDTIGSVINRKMYKSGVVFMCFWWGCFGQTLVVEMKEDTRFCGEYADDRTLLIVHRGLDKYR